MNALEQVKLLEQAIENKSSEDEPLDKLIEATKILRQLKEGSFKLTQGVENHILELCLDIF